MVVTVHLHTILRRQTPDGRQEQLDVTLLSGSTLADLIPDLGLAAAPRSMIMEVNGRPANSDHILHDGDQVHLKPAG
ncbi:MAG TPA: MoaD/ThiS family protein [Anaerolineae bacterium]|jgi:sulfur carrier protein ThiS|nr:MoaD/ThiS family protein [Anaerolineae bacterium]